MGLFSKMKNFAGGHGVTVAIAELDGGTPDAHEMKVDATVLRGVFRVVAEKDAAGVLQHDVVLTARFGGAGGKRAKELGRITHGNEYTVSPGEPKEVAFEFGALDLEQAMRSINSTTHALIVDHRVKLELSVLVDVKGSPVDPSVTHDVQVVDAAAEQAPAVNAAPGASAAGAGAASFAGRINALAEQLRAIPGLQVHEAVVNAPATEAQVASFRASAPFPVSEAFLDYYRSANGATLSWTVVNQRGGFTLLPLERIATNGNAFGADFADPGAYQLPFFGGIDEFAVRANLMQLETAHLSNSGPAAGLFGHSSLAPDPVVVFPTDAAASVTDCFPMRATSYFEMLLATAGHQGADTPNGIYGGMANDFPGAYGEKSWIIEWSPEQWAELGGGATYVQWLLSRGDVYANYAPAMSKLQDAIRVGQTSANISPKQWIEMRFGVPYSPA
ncbi:MAG: hypothetical protein AAF938_22035 [Myxococcota bacterium]